MIWYPYCQMKTMPPPLTVASAKGAELTLDTGEILVDGIASWWCVSHGYNHPELNAAVTDQLGKMAHVMLCGLNHEPAIKLANMLKTITPHGLNHVFFGDSGSVGVEIALKMAIQYWQNLGRRSKTKILSLERAYHGDTIGAMSVCDPEEGMHHLFSDIMPQQLFVPAPSMGYNPDPKQLQADIQIVRRVLEAHHTQVAAFIVEPLVQGAGGFNMYCPEYLAEIRRLCDRHEVLLICDEVATGFGRTGTQFAVEQAGITPDIMVLAKGLTAGYLAHSATLATDRVFSAFNSDNPQKAFMHGPTFMGNPVACEVALKAIEIFERDDFLSKIKAIESQLKQSLLPLKSKHHPGIRDVRVLGAIGVVEVTDPSVYDGFQDFAKAQGVWLRPFGNVIYTMPPYIISGEQLSQIIQAIKNWFDKPS